MSRFRVCCWSAGVAACGSAVVIAAGCGSILGYEDEYEVRSDWRKPDGSIPGAGGQGGNGGHGGNGGTAGIGGGVGGAGGSGGCKLGDGKCAGNVPQTCDAAGAWVDGAPCGGDTPNCTIGKCVGSSVANPNCAGLPNSCGSTGIEDCCASSVVPGGTFNRGNDPLYPATVSDFRMDLYEVTVGRFRRFVDAGYGTQAKPPAEGSGENPHLPASGWKSEWNKFLKADTPALKAALMVDASCTWTNDPVGSEDLPINNLSWLEAFAFCIWDGGRIPTYAESDYAARGGSEQRKLPWSSPPDSETCDCSHANSQLCGGVFAKKVGSHSPQGDARWGQADLVGNVQEALRDAIAPLPYPCSDCASVSQDTITFDRMCSFGYDRACQVGPDRLVNYFDKYKPLGIRCVRTP